MAVLLYCRCCPCCLVEGRRDSVRAAVRRMVPRMQSTSWQGRALQREEGPDGQLLLDEDIPVHDDVSVMFPSGVWYFIRLCFWKARTLLTLLS
jgi:hypothetical protein